MRREALTVEEIRAVYDLGPEAVIALVQRLLAILAQQQEQITVRQAVIAAQELKIAALKARVEELEDRLATNGRHVGRGGRWWSCRQ